MMLQWIIVEDSGASLIHGQGSTDMSQSTKSQKVAECKNDDMGNWYCHQANISRQF